MNLLFKLTIKWCILLIVGKIVESRNDAEFKLMEFLFANYSSTVRPTLNKSQPVNMTFGIAYVQLVKLDDREQTLISNIWVRQKWYNHLLMWNPADFQNITQLNVDPKRVWLPDVVLYNNAKSGLGAGTMYQFKTKVQLQYDGLNIWYAPTIIRSGCNIDITYFPFDTQRCELQFGSWTYTGYELDLFRSRTTADLSPYLESAEFDLVSAKATRKILKYSCCPTPYPNIFFTLIIRRQPGFFLFNVIIPSMVITFFAILTFTSPPNVGERISLAIESFLSLSFLCMMVADSIPINSDVSPLITKFLIACMTMISAALVLNLVSMNLCSSNPVPKWLKKVAFVYLGPCVGFCGGLKLGKSKLRNKILRKISTLQNMKIGSITGGNYITPHLHEAILSRIKNVNPATTNVKPKVSTEEENVESTAKPLLKSNVIPIGMTSETFDKIRHDMNDIIDRSTHEINQVYYRDFWKCLAQTVDRICVITFSLCFIFVSAVMLLKGYGHQVKVQDQKVA